jgi:hypothetical protein
MIRILAIAGLTLLAAPVLAQDYQPAPAGVEAQPLPPPPGVPDSNGPIALAPPPTAALPAPPSDSVPALNGQVPAIPVSPREGPEEKALDQSLGLPTTYVPPESAPVVKPSPREDAAIEDRINAVSSGAAPATAPVPAPVPVPPAATQTVYAPASQPSTVAPAPSHWEGPEERALDQAVPGTTLVAPQGVPNPDQPGDAEVRRLNGGE